MPQYAPSKPDALGHRGGQVGLIESVASREYLGLVGLLEKELDDIQEAIDIVRVVLAH